MENTTSAISREEESDTEHTVTGGWPRVLRALLRDPTYLHITALGLLWITMILLVHPVGEFPLNDDWSYAHSVKWLVEEHRLQFTGWVSMPLVAQVAWGVLFCVPFGFSFTALRVSTLTLGFVGVVATYLILRESQLHRRVALAGALLLAGNPVYFALSNTFMTDVPFLAWLMVSSLLFLRAMRFQSMRLMMAATATACVATLVRQLGLILPLAFGVLCAAQVRGRWRKIMFVALPFTLNVSVLLLYQHWLMTQHGLPAMYNVQREHLLHVLQSGIRETIGEVVSNGKAAVVYLGLFLLPFLLIQFSLELQRSDRRTRVWSIILAFSSASFVVWWLVAHNTLMPLAGNILVDVGVGALTLRDVFILHLPNYPTAPPAFWFAVTVAAGLGAGLLLSCLCCAVVRLWQCRLSSAAAFPSGLGLAASIGYLAPILIAGFFDRYLIALLPPLMLAVSGHREKGEAIPKVPGVCASLLLAAYLAYSVASVHDYHAWNRARWQALSFLVDEMRVPKSSIDGGFEFNGWWMYDPSYRTKHGKSWWWVSDDEYIVTFGNIPGYQTIRTYPYVRLLRPGQGLIHMVRRR